MQERIILENALDGNYRLYVYLFTLFSLTIPFAMIVELSGILRFIGVIVFMLILFAGISIWFIKKGFIKKGETVEIGYFSWGYLIFREGFGGKNKPIISILKFKKRERAGFRSFANPEFSASFNSFSIYLLNEKHTQKQKVISFKKEANVNLAVDFLLKNTKYKLEVYSPDFS